MLTSNLFKLLASLSIFTGQTLAAPVPEGEANERIAYATLSDGRLEPTGVELVPRQAPTDTIAWGINIDGKKVATGILKRDDTSTMAASTPAMVKPTS